MNVFATFFFTFSLSIDNTSIIKECKTDEYRNPYTLQCSKCENGKHFEIESGMCVQYSQNCSYNDTKYFGKCFNKSHLASLTSNFTDSFSVNGTKVTISKEYRELLAAAFDSVDIPAAIQVIANGCALSSYSNSTSCNFIKKITSKSDPIYGYDFWPSNSPFIDFNTTYHDMNSLNFITHSIGFKEVQQIYLSRYSKDGKFYGIFPWTSELQICHDPNQFDQHWREFGSNYEKNCYLNLPLINDTDTTDFFEPYYQDGVDQDGHPILRPMPVFTASGMYHRFFLADNYSSTEYQHIGRLSIHFMIRGIDTHTIELPYLNIDYITASRSLINTTLNNEIKPSPNSNSELTPSAKFEVIYSMNIDGYWKTGIALFVVFLIIGIAISLLMIFFKFQAMDINMNSILSSVCLILDVIGSIFFFLTWAFAFYAFLFFKGQHNLFWCLPSDSDFHVLIPFTWVSFGLMFASVSIHIYLQASFKIYFIDWETPRKKGAQTSPWRMVTIANELTNLAPTRSYSMIFTLLTLVFIFRGFDLEKLSVGFPGTELYKMKSSKVLRTGFDGIIFLAVLALEHIWWRGIYWVFFSNPFYNFLDRCTILNESVIFMDSDKHGYYLHGRSVHPHSDETIKKLSQELEDEKDGVVSLRGLIPNTLEQVFEFFVAPNLEVEIRHLSEQIDASASKKKIISFSYRNSAEIKSNAITSYNEFGRLMRSIIDESNSKFKCEIQKPSFMQKFFGKCPSLKNVSILTTASDGSFRHCILSGIERVLMIFYVISFVGIDVLTESPSIAIFVVYFFDLLVTYLYKYIVKKNIANETLLDEGILF